MVMRLRARRRERRGILLSGCFQAAAAASLALLRGTIGFCALWRHHQPVL